MKNPFRREKPFWFKSFWRRIKVAWARLRSAVTSAYARLAGRLERQAFVAKLRKADIVLASPRTLQLSAVNMMYRFFLHAKYVHSMLYLGDGKIIHTTSKNGVQIANLPRKIYKRGHYKVVRAKGLTFEQRDMVVEWALKMQGQQIDPAGLITNIPARMLGFKKPFIRMEKNRLWCAKLIYKAYSAAGIELVGQDHAGNVTTEDLNRSRLLKSISHK
jgi:hypothetical protein